MKLNKHIRNDLNMAHICCRAGIYKDFEKPLLWIKNKNNWLPIHLSKNKFIFDQYYFYTNIEISKKEIISYCIKNNAESSQTKYGDDLYNFLIEQGFMEKEARLGARYPSIMERLELSSYYLSQLENSWIETLDFNPIDIAIRNSNFIFLKAIKEQRKEKFFDYFRNQSFSKIGEEYLDKQEAFKAKQILKQYFNFNVDIEYKDKPNYYLKSNDPLKNLEGA